MNQPDYWLGKLSKLRVDRARGDPAPHEPILLLVLCDLAESQAPLGGPIQRNNRAKGRGNAENGVPVPLAWFWLQ